MEKKQTECEDKLNPRKNFKQKENTKKNRKSQKDVTKE